MILSLATLTASAARAAPKDESISSWLPLPQWFKDAQANLDHAGVDFSVTYVGDNIANTSGGMKQGAIHFGRLDTGVDIDLEKLTGWSGAHIHSNFYEIYGTGLTRNYIGNIAPVSEIEALPDTRLYEAWIEQSLANDRIAIKVGQQAADVEFFDSKTDDLFINGTFGWPAIMASDLPAGGPAPAIAVPGVRVKATLIDNVTAYAAIFNGNPAAPGPGDPQLRDDHGLAFRLQDKPWMIGQVRFDYNVNIAGAPMDGSITPGGWVHTGEFNDQRFASNGRLLADPLSSGVPAQVRGNDGVFLTIEQVLVHPGKDVHANEAANFKGISVFARAAYSPPDRNLIDFYADTGIGFNNMLASRPNDRFGFAFAYMHISSSARRFDQDMQVFTGLPTPVRDYEAVFESIYEAHIKDGWLLQPYFQYIFHPAGGAANPLTPGSLSRMRDSAVFGLTTTVHY